MNFDFITNQIKEAIAKIQAAKDQELNESIRQAEEQIIAAKNADFTSDYDRAVAKAQENYDYAKTVAKENLERRKAEYREEVISAIQKTVEDKYAETIAKLEAALPKE